MHKNSNSLSDCFAQSFYFFFLPSGFPGHFCEESLPFSLAKTEAVKSEHFCIPTKACSEPCPILHASAVGLLSNYFNHLKKKKRWGSQAFGTSSFPPIGVESANGLEAWKILQDSFPGQLSKGCAISIQAHVHALCSLLLALLLALRDIGFCLAFSFS